MLYLIIYRLPNIFIVMGTMIITVHALSMDLLHIQTAYPVPFQWIKIGFIYDMK